MKMRQYGKKGIKEEGKKGKIGKKNGMITGVVRGKAVKM